MATSLTPPKAASHSKRTGPLDAYKRKRDFSLTPEPAEAGLASAGVRQFVVQKHWASHLHYDLRLELDGTMKSWAVPKGPSYDPADKRMAIQVEDHPMSYNGFEGQIPPGLYGAGKVIIWDRGHWVPEGDPARGYRSGKLKFTLQGHKLQGRWTLVRMRAKPEERQPAWLLIKERDGHERAAAQFNVAEDMPDSVATLPAAPGQTPGKRQARPRASAKAPLPQRLAPQLATLVDHPPADAEHWLFESKFDGYRLLARVASGEAHLFTRNGHDWTGKMPALAKAVAGLALQSGWIDGEVVMLGEHGRPDFQALQNAFDAQTTQALVYFAFDLPFMDGRDLRALPVEQRRALLKAVLDQSDAAAIRLSQAFDAPPADLLAAACKLGMEGVIGKRLGSAYVSRRSADWIKLKCGQRQEFVVAGFTEPKWSRTGLGALILGVHGKDGILRAAGSVGTGFSTRSLAELHRRLSALQVPESPLADTHGFAADVHWVRPTLAAEVSFAGWTRDQRLRHAVFHGLRSDKPAGRIVREEPVAMDHVARASSPQSVQASRGSKSVPISHPERVIDTTVGITKLELARYYAAVAPVMISHLGDRPMALLRAPAGIDGELFFQKHLDQTTIEGVQALEPELDPGHAPLMAVTKPAGLVAAAQMNAVEFHTWNARQDRIDRPDRLTFDLDPGEGVPWEHLQEAATLLRVLLEELKLPAFLKTSGGKGLHIVVPIKRLYDWDTAKGFSQAVVQHLAQTIPQRFVAKSGPRNRMGKIFVDYLRNGFGATTACAWTARARPGMGISVPVAWTELDKLTGSAHWTIRSVDQRLRLGNAPWADYGKAGASLSAAMKALGFAAQRRTPR